VTADIARSIGTSGYSARSRASRGTEGRGAGRVGSA
jgi:hypothetical protein